MNIHHLELLSPRVRALPLPDFPPVTIGALWQGRATAVTQAFLDAMKLRASALAGASAPEKIATPA